MLDATYFGGWSALQTRACNIVVYSVACSLYTLESASEFRIETLQSREANRKSEDIARRWYVWPGSNSCAQCSSKDAQAVSDVVVGLGVDPWCVLASMQIRPEKEYVGTTVWSGGLREVRVVKCSLLAQPIYSSHTPKAVEFPGPSYETFR